jgi:hypothetical protein
MQPIGRSTSQHSKTSVQPIRAQRGTAKLLCSQSGARKSNNGTAIAHVPKFLRPPPPLSRWIEAVFVLPGRPLRQLHVVSSALFPASTYPRTLQPRGFHTHECTERRARQWPSTRHWEPCAMFMVAVRWQLKALKSISKRVGA